MAAAALPSDPSALAFGGHMIHVYLSRMNGERAEERQLLWADDSFELRFNRKLLAGFAADGSQGGYDSFD